MKHYNNQQQCKQSDNNNFNNIINTFFKIDEETMNINKSEYIVLI